MKSNFKVDFNKKIISHIGISKKIYPVKELYSFLMDLFDEPENMKYDIPIIAKSKDNFKLINGWQLSSECPKFIKGDLSQ